MKRLVILGLLMLYLPIIAANDKSTCENSNKINNCRFFAAGKSALQAYLAYHTFRLGVQTASEAKECFALHRDQTECLIGLESSAMSLALFYTTYRLGRMIWRNTKIVLGKCENKKTRSQN